ncbi:MAG: hypothetical protein ACI9BW_002664 [Gammaproteobacteria bacterium]|jgi:hypothetical protein
MQKERRTYGSISDGYGKRYLIFWLYFVLGDLKGSGAYIRWYEKTFEDDIGEPVHKLCCALLLRRLGKNQKAKYVLADLMLTNLYIIPKVLGEKAIIPRVRYGSNYSEEEYANEIPVEVLGSITDAEKEWMKELYESIEFHRYRKRYIEINQKLENTHGVEKRRPLVREASGLLNELKESYS